MQSQPTTFKSGALSRVLRVISIARVLPALVLLLSIRSSHAGSATWQASPANGDWNTAGNWTAGGPPNGSADTAIFASSNTTGVSLSLNTEVNGIVFNASASPFTVTLSPAFTLTISGVGITNNSGITQNFLAAVDNSGNIGVIKFTNSATAGSLSAFTNNGSNGGQTEFFDTSTAGDCTFINNGASLFGGVGSTSFHGDSTAGNGTFINNGGLTESNTLGGGVTVFLDASTAGNGTFTNNGSVLAAQFGGATIFYNSSTAGNGTFTNNGGAFDGAYGGGTLFVNTSTAGGATLIAGDGPGSDPFLGGTITFSDFSTGGTARVEVFGNGYLDISSDVAGAGGLTTGSIEGTGVVFLGDFNLTVGTNNLSTAFSGAIQDCGPGGCGATGGSLTKTGKGKLTLSSANTYTGGTTINRGALLATNTTGSATGVGAVAANAGTLGGSGIISGAVTIGTGSGRGALLAPAFGSHNQATLTLQSSLTLQANATYTYTFKARANQTRTDLVKANGVTINGATIALKGKTQGTLTPGTVLTVISNTSANPINGTFGNLADGAIVNVNGNNLQASYTGGDGNDLTLTVQ